MKRFETQLKALLAGLDKNERLSPSDLINRVNELRSGAGDSDTVIATALKNPRFVKKIVKAARRSDSGRVVLYSRKGDAMAMTLERMIALQRTVKSAQEGVRKYWAHRRKAPADHKTPVTT